MPDWTANDLRREFSVARRNGWIEAFQVAAKDYLFPVELLLAIASRETNMRSIVGDGGHGYGLMQIDDRSYPDWCHSGGWKNVAGCIQKGALVLDGKREQIRNGQGQTLRVGGTSFRGEDNLSDEDLLRVAVAAYNAGLWAYACMSRDHDPDLKTAHRNYSSDTLARAEVFHDLL